MVCFCYALLQRSLMLNNAIISCLYIKLLVCHQFVSVCNCIMSHYIAFVISDDNIDSAGDEAIITAETADQSSGRCAVLLVSCYLLDYTFVNVCRTFITIMLMIFCHSRLLQLY